MKKICVISLFMGILMLIGLTGCSSNIASDKTSAKQATTKASADLSNVTLRVGQTGWGTIQEALKASGLDDTPYKVEYSVFQGGNLILEAMTAGHIDFGITSEIPPLFSALSQNGDHSKVIAIQQSNTLQQELVVAKGSEIKTVADLKGKKVAYVQNTTAHYFLIKMLEEAGLTWNDIRPVQLTTSDGLAALLGGKVDALASYGNAIISAHQNGAKTLASAKDILSGDFQINALTDAISDPRKHAAIVDLLDRINQANKWERENPEKWAKIVATNTNQPYEQALKTFKEGEEQRPTRVIPLTETKTESQQDIANIFNSVGIINKKIDVNTFWSHEFDKELAKITDK
ncbi:ABC transporter substrate-binding protein [Neobacillus cucumis]|uniref:ABC transporter substrate-binding protein n=1 Tax=Neobacillus cucumis TaxID=1740721 RepID=UPI001EF84B68|nr:ABC transporter substrate-binding protein [Neobacillus cucumis]MBM7652367.1 sulfonate transport system substrate-binding protein [Neobacillus cucumis]